MIDIEKLYKLIKQYLGEEDYDIVRQYYNRLDDLENKLKMNNKINIAIVGAYSTGKSYFINSLLNENILPTGDIPITSVPSILVYGDNRSIKVIEQNGEEEIISIETFAQIIHAGDIDDGDYKEIHLTYKSQYLQNYNIIDTPGFGTANKEVDDQKTYEIVKNKADLIIWLFDVNNGTIKEDERQYIKKVRKKLVKM